MNRHRYVFTIFLFVIIPLNSGVAGELKVYSSEGLKTLYFRDADPSKTPQEKYRKIGEKCIRNCDEGRVPSKASSKSSDKQPWEASTQPPPIAQTLIREGDFAIKLAEALKIGRARNEAEAESMLASVGITPKNGWIADYPVTPDVIGELENAIGPAVDSGKLALSKEEATKALEDLTAQLHS